VLSVNNETVGSKSRVIHVALLSLNLRLMENWRSAQGSAGDVLSDHESLMIIMATIVINSERVLRTELELELQTLESLLPEDRTGRANFSSIAAATGINRETVRRKVNKLREAGWLMRDGHGIKTVPGAIPYEIIEDIIRAQLDAITRTVNQLAKFGVFFDQFADHSTKSPDNF
jgi:predicted transcriptional regulator